MDDPQHKLPPGWDPDDIDSGGAPLTPRLVESIWKYWSKHSGLTRSEHEQRERCRALVARMLSANGIYLEELFEADFHGPNFGDYVGITPRESIAVALGFSTINEALAALTEANTAEEVGDV